jgi:plasmid replication initiation protein
MNLNVVKHNALITGKQNLSLVEQRFMLSIVAMIDSKSEWDGKNGRYTINILDTINLIDNKNPNKRMQMLNVTDELLSKTVTIKLKDLDDNIKETFKKIQLEPDDEPLDYNSEIIQTNWILPPVRYRTAMDDLVVSIDKFMMPFLIELKSNFASIPLMELLKLRSKYSIRMVELLASSKYKKEVDYLYSDFRELLGIGEKYSKFTDLQKYVIDNARDELIEQNSYLQFDYTVERRRRKPYKINFKIKVKKHDLNDCYDEDTIDKLTKSGIQSISTYWKEGLRREHWLPAFELDTPSKIVTKARDLYRAEIKDAPVQKEKTVKEINEYELISKNKTWWDAEGKVLGTGYTGSSSSPYIYTKDNQVFSFNREDFILVITQAQEK